MDEKQMKESFASVLAEIHNNLVEISVKGEDAIKMADVIRYIRNMVVELRTEKSE